MKEDKMTPRKIQGVETKKRLYENAEKLFALYEFDEVSVNDIVKASGVSKGTFYVHFESKDALIASLIYDYVTAVDIDYETYLNSLDRNMPVKDRFLLLIGKIANVLIHNIGHNRMNAVYKVQLTSAVDTEHVKGYNRKLYKIFSNELNVGIQKGEFKTDLTLEQLTRHFVMAIRGLSYEWCIRYPDFDLKEQALIHFSLLLSGIRGNK